VPVEIKVRRHCRQYRQLWPSSQVPAENEKGGGLGAGRPGSGGSGTPPWPWQLYTLELERNTVDGRRE
jgi:hypothetical protein